LEDAQAMLDLLPDLDQLGDLIGTYAGESVREAME
jgi:hypothetical protein